MPEGKGRRGGSNLLSFLLGALLAIVGWCIADGGFLPCTTTHLARQVDYLSCFVFGAVLWLWTFADENHVGLVYRLFFLPYRLIKCETPFFNWNQNPERDRFKYFCKEWGIGFETITMVVGVVAAIFAIFVFANEALKNEAKPAPPQVQVICQTGSIQPVTLANGSSKQAAIQLQIVCQAGPSQAAAPPHPGK